MEQGSSGHPGAADQGRVEAAGGTPLDAETIERLRRSGIEIDREGELWHEGEVIRHEGLRQALFRWLDRGDDGRTILRLDPKRFAYVDVTDTPLVARSARLDGERVQLGLSDGSEETLDPTSLDVDGAGVLRCRVRGGRLSARLASSAAVVVAERIVDASAPVLELGGRSFPIARRA